MGLLDTQLNIVDTRCFPTVNSANGGEITCDKIAESLHQMCSIHSGSLIGAGIVCAGPVDPCRGTVENPYTLEGFGTFPINGYLREKLNVDTQLENDVNGALLGEIKLKQLAHKHVLMVSIGTGIGVAYHNGNSLYATRGRFHPEMGHQIVGGDSDCYCGNSGCFESQCSGTAINARAQKLGYADFGDLLAHNSEADFIAAVQRQYKSGIWNLLTIFKPEILILGGGFAHAHYDFIEKAAASAYAPDFTDSFTIMKAQDNAKAALVGAGMLIKQKEM